jgi:hypothetical protein
MPRRPPQRETGSARRAWAESSQLHGARRANGSNTLEIKLALRRLKLCSSFQVSWSSVQLPELPLRLKSRFLLPAHWNTSSRLQPARRPRELRRSRTRRRAARTCTSWTGSGRLHRGPPWPARTAPVPAHRCAQQESELRDRPEAKGYGTHLRAQDGTGLRGRSAASSSLRVTYRSALARVPHAAPESHLSEPLLYGEIS